MPKCPGQDLRYWKPDDIFDITCPECGASIEFWKDDPKLKCPKCKKSITNPKLDLSCAEWCKYAKECLGTLASQNSSVLSDILIEEMRKVFGDDQKRINHTLEVLKYAEQILLVEGGEPLIVKAAAVLHDIGIHKAQSKHGSTAGEFQELEGSIIAREILAKHGVDLESTEHICQIIANHHSAKNIDTIEFRIIWDADWLVNFPEQYPDADKKKTEESIDKIFKTKEGHRLATERFAN